MPDRIRFPAEPVFELYVRMLYEEGLRESIAQPPQQAQSGRLLRWFERLGSISCFTQHSACGSVLGETIRLFVAHRFHLLDQGHTVDQWSTGKRRIVVTEIAVTDKLHLVRYDDCVSPDCSTSCIAERRRREIKRAGKGAATLARDGVSDLAMLCGIAVFKK